MQRTQPALAKLTRPRLHGAVRRDRLFLQLDAARVRPALCVVGPPGAGKTTLVASWQDARDIPGIWYQVDPGDADLSTFFYYLGVAARPFSRKGQRALPALTPEYLHDVAGFARRFFRELYARLPSGASLVLDNYQEVPPDQAFHQVVADAVAEVPAGASLIVVSRRDPPDCYARLIANENVAFIDWDDLRLTLEETRAIVAVRGALPEQQIERLHADSGGWAAGVTLMLEGRRGNDAPAPDPLRERDALFNYFAAQIIGQVPESTRQFLMATALLPQVPVSLARELTGEARAAEILEDLYQRHLFTHRRPGSEPTYWYHALFRNYLLVQSARTLSDVERRDHQRRAARLLEAHCDFDDAFLLFRAAQDWDAGARLVERQATELLAQGRWQTLRDWILALPAPRVENDPWLRYWLGTSIIPTDQREARDQLQASYTLFATAGNLQGQALAAAGVLDTYYFEWFDFGPMRVWVERLEPFIEQNLFADAPERELKVYASMLIGIFYGAHKHPMLRRCVERVSEMLDERFDVNSKLKAATYLLTYCNLSGELALGQRVVARAAPLIESREVTPLNELWWFLRLGHFHTMLGDFVSARAALDQVRATVSSHGLSGLRSAALLIRSYEMVVACMQQDLETAQRFYAETESLVTHSRPMDMWHLTQGKVYLSLLRRDAHALCKWGRAAHTAALVEGMAYTVVLSLLHEAHGLVEFGRSSRFDEILKSVRGLVAESYLAYFECEVDYVEAYAQLKHGSRDAALHAVANAVRNAREREFHYPNLFRFSTALPALMATALEEGFETDHVRDVVRRFRLQPPTPDLATWPWPVKIYALGRFEVQIDEAPLRFAGKSPRKPLALLKAIVALGGRDVPQSRLVDALWPDDEGDAGKQALGVALVRLRKLLGAHDAIQVAEERVSLNPMLCWVDTWAFERKLKCAEAMRAQGHQAEGITGLHGALALYVGQFLPAEAEQPWSVQYRLRLRGLFTTAIEDLGEHHEARAEWERAIACYRRGLEADDLIEEFYLGLMRCYRALGRSAEGMAVYRRLRQTLSVVLGVAPSHATEAAARALRDGGSTASK